MVLNKILFISGVLVTIDIKSSIQCFLKRANVKVFSSFLLSIFSPFIYCYVLQFFYLHYDRFYGAQFLLQQTSSWQSLNGRFYAGGSSWCGLCHSEGIGCSMSYEVSSHEILSSHEIPKTNSDARTHFLEISNSIGGLLVEKIAY
ncbi:hypothetical protein Tco_0018483 [Tanacetum coccineum]